MIKIFIFIIALYLSISVSQAEIVNKIIIDGNQRVSDETVKIYGEIKINSNYSDSDLNKILNNLYSTEFFDDVTINLNNNILKINLKEYPVINQLVIVGEKSNKYKEQIKKIIKLKEKQSFIKSYLAKDIELIKELYSSLGYNFTKIEVKQKKITNNKYDLVFSIYRGDQTKISQIDFIGNNKMRARRLLDVIASEEDKFWKVLSRNTNLSENLLNLDKRLLTNYYKSHGFYDVKINSNFAEISNKGNAKLVYSIEEGKRYIVKKISTNVDSVFDKKIFFPLNDIYKDYIGDYYSPFKIKKLLQELDLLIEKNNLQFVEHNVQEIIEQDGINIIFNISEGEKILVERINITGNSITNEDVIRGELILDEGDPFTKLSLEKSIAEIKERNIFKNVNYELKEGSKSNLKIITIDVEEKPTGEITAGAGIGTNGGSFAFNVRENNWLGQGKTVGFEIEVDQESLGGMINYSNPNYDFLGNSITYYLANESNDKPDQGYENSITSAGVSTSFEQYKDIRASIGLDVSYDDLRTQSGATSALKNQGGTYTDLSTNYGFSYDKRDRVFMPTDGSIVGFNQSLPLYADRPSISNVLTSSSYKTLTEDVIGAGKFYITNINSIGSDDVRLSKRKFLSSRRLRGFEKGKIGPVDGKDHVGGNYAAALNLEANLPNLLPEDTNVDISFYLDFGNVWGVDYDKSLDDSNKLRSSTGVLASWMSPVGPMTFTFSQNLSKASTDITESFNFNLGTTF